MNHRSYGRFINAQAEGHGAHHDAYLIGHPFFLVLAPRGVLHLAVIADGGDAVFLEEIDGVTHARDGGGVDNDAAVRDLSYGAKEQIILRSGVALANDVSQIGPSKAGDVFVGIAEAELLDDVVADALGGAGGESGDGAGGEKFAEAAELAELGPEFMPPLGNTMGFVDGEEGDGQGLQPFCGAAERNALR